MFRPCVPPEMISFLTFVSYAPLHNHPDTISRTHLHTHPHILSHTLLLFTLLSHPPPFHPPLTPSSHTLLFTLHSHPLPLHPPLTPSQLPPEWKHQCSSILWFALNVLCFNQTCNGERAQACKSPLAKCCCFLNCITLIPRAWIRSTVNEQRTR